MKLRIGLLLVGLPLGLLVLSLTNPDASAQILTNLHSFLGFNDGATPFAGLIQANDGNFYGTTSYGGTSTNCYGGCGTVFRISPSGSYTTLYSFGGTLGDGLFPVAGLVQGSDGSFYGTTSYGGTSTNCYGGCGTVFRISPSGSYTSLYSFGSSRADGNTPAGGLVQGSDGNFYGTTSGGGTGVCVDYNPITGDGPGIKGCGTVFRISPGGSYTSLYSFAGYPSDGSEPWAGLMRGSDGNFYGTTFNGGTNSFYFGGTVFRISPSGRYTSLHSFGGPYGPYKDGENPQAGLVEGSDGNLYGTTTAGGGSGGGTVFRISPTGGYAILYFLGRWPPANGYHPEAGLVQGADGSFYGTTWRGGSHNDGTVFKLSFPLSPPANQISGIQFFKIFDSTIVALPIPSVAGETYQLQYSDSMTSTNWLNTGGTITSIGGPLVLIDLAEPLPRQRFYRAVITP